MFIENWRHCKPRNTLWYGVWRKNCFAPSKYLGSAIWLPYPTSKIWQSSMEFAIRDMIEGLLQRWRLARNRFTWWLSSEVKTRKGMKREERSIRCESLFLFARISRYFAERMYYSRLDFVGEFLLSVCRSTRGGSMQAVFCTVSKKKKKEKRELRKGDKK